ncbi:MAG: phosphate ABC transporter permease PstA [Gammaproteobacteria bacterium]
MNKPTKRRPTAEIVQAGLRRRYAAERRFRFYGLAAVLVGLLFLSTLLVSIVGQGWPAFQQTQIRLDIHFDPEQIAPPGTVDPDQLGRGNYAALYKAALRELFPEVGERREQSALYGLMSSGAGYELRARVLGDPSLIGQTRSLWLTADDEVDLFVKQWSDEAGGAERLSEQEIGWLERLDDAGRVETRFNARFFTSGDSREPELAGIRGAVVGSFFMLSVTLLVSFPIGVATAVYLEEFAPRNRWIDLIEVNINNLAAVPSIVFGLLGLAVFINFFGLPRSAPLVGGLVLSLMTLPTIIIASRAAITAVPPSIREAALGMGASRMQMVTQHVLPLAMPGMLTGTILGMAHALGETAPLLMIGMVAFIVDIPDGFGGPATALPVQIFLWADSPERAFVAKTSAAIMVLLGFLLTMNAAALLLRRRFEKRRS